MSRRCCRLLATATVAMLLALAVPASAGSFSFVERPSCTGVTTTVAKSSFPLSSDRYNVAYRIRCNFGLHELSFRTSKALVRVQPRPALDRPDPEDSLICAKSSTTLARCKDEVGQDVRIRGGLKVRGRVCGSDPVRIRFRAEGGIDCEVGEVCPDIGYRGVVTARRPRGC